MTARAVRLLHSIKLADGKVLDAGTVGIFDRASADPGFVRIRFPLPGVPGAFSSSVTLDVDGDSVADLAASWGGRR